MKAKRRGITEMRKSVLRAIRSTAIPAHILFRSRLAWGKLQTELKYLEEEGLIRCVVEKRMVKRKKSGRKKSDAPLGKLSDNPRTHLVKRYFLTDKGVKNCELDEEKL